ncbi:MAG: amidohydrolase [Candidatus Bathyarchaeota archaeon]|nr:amidohydrolase [Candidatus Bathyarchaeota archaeon]
MAELTKEKETAFGWIDGNSERISDFHQLIWRYAEPALREYNSCRAFVRFHREEGFEVEEGIAGMPTAYLAAWGSGRPVIATYTEYDAVPGTAQEPVTSREAPNPLQAGHTDPHSALGVAALVGAVATKHAMEEHGLGGTVKVFGAPAEKICVAKPFQAARGYYDGLDAAVTWHPRQATTVMYETQFGSYWCVAFVFRCDEPEKWISHAPDLPRQARAPAALDAVCLMYTTTKYTKEAMLPHTGYWTLNEAVLVAGQCTSDNIPPRIGVITYAFRAPSLAQQEQIYRVLQNNAEAVAKVTCCTVETRWVTKTRTGLPNIALADLAYENLELVGPLRWTEDEKQIAREIARNLGHEPPEEPYNEALTPPEEWERMTRQGIPPHQRCLGSDDYVEFTWHCPTVWIQVARPFLRIPGVRLPSWVHYALGGMRGVIDRTIYTAGKAISGTMLDLVTDPAKLGRCQKEFKRRTSEYKEEPLLPPDLEPPIDLRWPEYVTTVRGREWWIPPTREA